MQRTLLIFVALAFIVSLSINIYAENTNTAVEYSDYAIDVNTINYKNSPLNKLLRGTINIMTCWTEIPAGALDASNKQTEHRVIGWFYGSTVGSVTTLFRVLTGAFDVITFLIPPYNKSLMKPEYAYQNLQDKIEEHR